MNNVKEKFEAMGARVKVSDGDRTVFNVLNDRKGEYFEIRVNPTDEITVVDLDRRDRHALVQVRTPGTPNRFGVVQGKEVSRFLCGHDERHWFVAGVTRPVVKIEAAKDSLKPAGVAEAERRAGVRHHKRNKRHNSGSLRQGEWFMVPTPDIIIDSSMILRNEPLRRGRGKVHNMEYACREGGTSVMVCSHYPNGLTRPQYEKLVKDNADAQKWMWRPMQRDAAVYAKGRITHADHATLDLGNVWHRVYMNTEAMSSRVAFLD